MPGRERTLPRLGGYVLTERIGQGGMAVVYKAKREGWSGFEKTVVVKAMLPNLAANPEHVEMFIAEAKISAQLSHPGIVQVHDFGVWNGTPYLVMDYLDGINLQQIQTALATGTARMPVGVAVVIATEICHALGYAHAFVAPDGSRRQIIHSDVSPANVMVCRDGAVRLLDFGVARVVDEFDYDTSLAPKGKYAYMAPEQVTRLPIDRRADVFATGIVLHELLTGRRLFSGVDEMETLRNVDRCEVLPPSLYNPEVPPSLDQVVLKALARDPADRFDSGNEMALALGEVTRVGGGKRRVAEFLATVFPYTWTVSCASCGSAVTPGLECRVCGTEAPIELPKVVEGTQPGPTPDAMAADESASPALVAEPLYPLADGTTQRRRNGIRTATVAVGLLGAVMGVGASERARSWLKTVGRDRPGPPSPPSSPAVEGTPTAHALPSQALAAARSAPVERRDGEAAPAPVERRDGEAASPLLERRVGETASVPLVLEASLTPSPHEPAPAVSNRRSIEPPFENSNERSKKSAATDEQRASAAHAPAKRSRPKRASARQLTPTRTPQAKPPTAHEHEAGSKIDVGGDRIWAPAFTHPSDRKK